MAEKGVGFSVKENIAKEWLEVLQKRAAGYVATETQEEYAVSEGETVLVKRKIVQKDVPPDVTALKLLLEIAPCEEVSGEELERERLALQEAALRLRFLDKLGMTEQAGAEIAASLAVARSSQ